jgi:cytochrome b
MIVMVLWPAVCTCTHLILTGSILYGLYRTREGANHTRHMVDRVIFMSLESQTPATLL